MQMICALLIFQTPELPDSLWHLSPWLDNVAIPLGFQYGQLAEQQHRRFIKTHTPLDGISPYPEVTYHRHGAASARHVRVALPSQRSHRPPTRGFRASAAAKGTSAVRPGRRCRRAEHARRAARARRAIHAGRPAQAGRAAYAGRWAQASPIPRTPECRRSCRRRCRQCLCRPRCCTRPCSVGSPTMRTPAGTLTHCPASYCTCPMPGPGETSRMCSWCTTTT